MITIAASVDVTWMPMCIIQKFYTILLFISLRDIYSPSAKRRQ